MTTPLRVAIAGLGTVGAGVIRLIDANGELIARRAGRPIEVVAVSARDRAKDRGVDIGRFAWVDDPVGLGRHEGADVVVELIGGSDGPALALARTSVSAGKSFVTANKAMIAHHGLELARAAEDADVALKFEAAVAGGVPVIKGLREGAAANEIARVYGILTGTCNYILTRMQAEGATFQDVLADAQRLGYAESDPSLDVDGHDAAHKTGILASLAHGFWVNPRHIPTEGIRQVTPLDLKFAAQLGYSIRLLGIVKKEGRGPVQVSVYPALIPQGHVMASVSGVFNAVYVRGDVVGDTLYYGRGAGAEATASAVLGDLADAALDLKHDSTERVQAFVPHERNGALQPPGGASHSYYLRLDVVDRPGVLARIATLLARGRIGISSVIQPEGHEGASVPLILMIHHAPEAAMARAMQAIGRLAAVRSRPVMMRVEPLT